MALTDVKGHYRISKLGKRFWIARHSRNSCEHPKRPEESRKRWGKYLTEYNKSERGRKTSSRIGKLYGVQNLSKYVKSEKFLEDNRKKIIAYNKSEKHRQTAGRTLSRLRHPTKYQKILSKALNDKNIPNVLELRIPSIHRVIDVAIIPKKLAIEVDGSIHKYMKEDDNLKDEQLKFLGWRVLRFTNEEVNNDLNTVIGRIEYDYVL
jgi:very-short-patch-repair endonuclease